MKKNNGITLIALVITIIVLLILAGVSIAMITSQDGILGKSKLAKAKNEVGATIDSVTIKMSELQADFYDKKYVQGKTTTDDANLVDIQTYVLKNLTGITNVEVKEATNEIVISSASDSTVTATAVLENGTIKDNKWTWSK